MRNLPSPPTLALQERTLIRPKVCNGFFMTFSRQLKKPYKNENTEDKMLTFL